MSKFCENCGAEMEENETVCKSCAPKTEPEEAKVEEPVAENTTSSTNEPAGKSKDVKKLAIIGGGIAVAVVALIVLIVSIVGGRYKAPIKNYYKGLNKCDASTYMKAFPEFVNDKVNKNLDDDDLKDDKKDDEKVYGDNIKYSYKILKKTKIDKDDLKNVQEYVEKTYDEKVKITKGFKVKIEAKTKGKDDYSYGTMTEYVYKIDGKWYKMNVSPETAKKSIK